MWSKRPDPERWMGVGNADPDRLDAYERAAKKLGIKIKIAYPNWCHAGADVCAQMGMKGIYIRRDDAKRERELTNEMWNQERLWG